MKERGTEREREILAGADKDKKLAGLRRGEDGEISQQGRDGDLRIEGKNGP